MESGIALLIPIFSVIGGLILGGYAIAIDYRKRELRHKERIKALENGLPIPPEITEFKNPILAHKNASIVNRKAFVIILFLGLAFLLLGELDEGMRVAGVLMVFLGLGFLVLSLLKYKITSEEKEAIDWYDKQVQQHSPKSLYSVPVEKSDYSTDTEQTDTDIAGNR